MVQVVEEAGQVLDSPFEPAGSKLERILEVFEGTQLFRLPNTLSKERPAVTTKYSLSMIGLAQDLKLDVVPGFCEQFGADEGQMGELFSDPLNWMDYLLYGVFGVYTQKQMARIDRQFENDMFFFDRTTEKTFLNYDDKQIQIARHIPLPLLIRLMDKQNANWNKVTELKGKLFPGSVVRYERNTRSEFISYIIDHLWDGKEEQTIQAYKDLLRKKYSFNEPQEIPGDPVKILLQRDCDYTLSSFRTSFQQLFRQPDLAVEREASEGKGDRKSVYIVRPTKPYKSKIVGGINNVARFMLGVFLPWLDAHLLRQENREHQENEFVYQSTLHDRTQKLAKTSAELERRQDQLLDILGQLAKVKSSANVHQIRNEYVAIEDAEKTRTYNTLAQTITTIYAVSEAARPYLEKMCEPFGVTGELLTSPSKLSRHLSKMVLDDKVEDKGEKKAHAPAAQDDPLAALRGAWAKVEQKQIWFAQAYDAFLAYKQSHKFDLEEVGLEHFDPFQQIYGLITLTEIETQFEETYKTLGELKILEPIKVSEIYKQAVHASKAKPGWDHVEFEWAPGNYDPEFKTDPNSFRDMIRDAFYNAIDAGATRVRFHCVNPRKQNMLPLEEKLETRNKPKCYMAVEDNGSPIPEAKVMELNEYFSGASHTITSTKSEKGGEGSRNMKRLLPLHMGYAHYQETGKKLELLFERLHI